MSMESVSESGSIGAGPPLAAPSIGDRKTPRSEEARKGSPSPDAAEAARRPDAAEPGMRDSDVDREQLAKVVQDANNDISTLNRSLKFRVHEGSGQLMVQIVDRNSGEVARTNPPVESLELAVRMREMVGFFLDTKG